MNNKQLNSPEIHWHSRYISEQSANMASHFLCTTVSCGLQRNDDPEEQRPPEFVEKKAKEDLEREGKSSKWPMAIGL